MTKAVAANKSKKEETIEVTQEPLEANTEAQAEPTQSIHNVLVHRFTPEDAASGNPALCERLYKTFQPMGIHDKPEAIASLMSLYTAWYAAKEAEIKAEEKRKQDEVKEKLRAMAEKAGIQLTLS
jgi:hypothetical protein